MLPRVAALSLPAPFVDRRHANRRTFTLSFDAGQQLGTTAVSILDLSQTGMRIRSTANLEVGEYLEVELPEAGTVSAIVVRSARMGSENEYGTEFLQPISQGAVSAALLAAPAVPSSQQHDAPFPDPHVEKLRYRTRLLILGGLTLATWALVGAIGYAIVRMI
ncbi:MAG: hypothetical protein B7Y88_02025 [Sphingomonadales bacterium 32-64-17]|nr:MAG: hypothetical protein B7Y88_02025 [Sphingomonadales bacterium 32-64-17]